MRCSSQRTRRGVDSGSVTGADLNRLLVEQNLNSPTFPNCGVMAMLIQEAPGKGSRLALEARSGYPSRAPQHRQLMPQQQVLDDEVVPRAY